MVLRLISNIQTRSFSSIMKLDERSTGVRLKFSYLELLTKSVNYVSARGNLSAVKIVGLKVSKMTF